MEEINQVVTTVGGTWDLVFSAGLLVVGALLGIAVVRKLRGFLGDGGGGDWQERHHDSHG
jgi:hypothetical protein